MKTWIEFQKMSGAERRDYYNTAIRELHAKVTEEYKQRAETARQNDPVEIEKSLRD
jgi:hypothetical protein